MNAIIKNRRNMICIPCENEIQSYENYEVHYLIEQGLNQTFIKSAPITKLIKDILLVIKVEINNINKVNYNKIENYLNKFIDCHYSITHKQFDNWWDFQIGIPLVLLDAIILLEKNLSFKVREKCFSSIKHFVKFDSNNTGANLLDKSFVTLVISSYEEDVETQDLMIENLNNVYSFVKNGDGFYNDGGFIQHYDIPYLGGYGQVLVERTRDYLYLIKDTKLLSKVNKKKILSILDGNVLRFIYNGAIADLTLGRGSSRDGNSSSKQGLLILTNLLIIYNCLNRTEKIEQVMEQILLNFEFKNGASILSSFEQKYIAKYIENVEFENPIVKHENDFISSMLESVHIREDFAFYVGLTSDYISSFEYGNGENKSGWYMHAGSSWLVLKGIENFSNTFYATVDMLRLAGTTTDCKSGKLKPWHGYYNKSDYVGGITDGKNGFSSMELEMKEITGSNLKSHKSYFQIDESLFFMGSKINKSDCETIIENRQVNDCKIFVDGKQLSFGDNISCEKTVVLHYSDGCIIYTNYTKYKWNVEYIECFGTYQMINEKGSSHVYSDKYLIIKQKHEDNSKYSYSVDINKPHNVANTCVNDAIHMLNLNDYSMYAVFAPCILDKLSTQSNLLLQIDNKNNKLYVVNPTMSQKIIEFTYDEVEYCIDFTDLGRNVVCVEKGNNERAY